MSEDMESQGRSAPLSMSVVVLTYRRQDELVRTLTGLQTHLPAGIEVLVVNNHEDDTKALIAREFPHVRCLETGRNIGCEARNIGVSACSGDIVVTLDNDVNVEGAGFADAIRDFFRRREKAGCVSFTVLDPAGAVSRRDWCHPRDRGAWADTEFQTDHISEGACAFRKRAFTEAGGYYAPFFIGHEGPDLCLRLIKLGFETWYTPAVRVVHHASHEARPGWRAYYYNTRNNIWLAYRHYPGWYALKYALLYTGMALFYAMRDGNIIPFWKGVLHGVTQAKGQRRDPLDKNEFEKLLEMHAFKPSLARKMVNHLFCKDEYR